MVAIFLLFQVWFKNRRAKCRQQLQQQQNKPSAAGQRSAVTSPTKAKPSKPSPANVSPNNLPPTVTANQPSNSPPALIKKEHTPAQIAAVNSYKAASNGNRSSTSSVITTPSPPMTPSNNPASLGHQHESSSASYNSYNWHSNGHSSSPHHYYGQNYGQAYYNTHMDYFNQQNGQTQMQMGSHHHHVGSSYHQMGSYAGMTMTSHHQNFSPRHPDCSLDYMNQMV